MKAKKILLAGATGYLGSYIAKELIKQSYEKTGRDRSNLGSREGDA